jgi:flagellar M-ring protein FliF
VDPQQFFTRLKTLASALKPAQIATLAVAFVGIVVLVGGSALWLGSTSYSLLFSDMDAESAADVVSRLKTLKVPHELDQGGRSVRVPADRVDELRLEFSAQGVPASGRIGFEIFDRTAFGATEFLEHVNYRRALEGEIARTISTISEVSGARVHIAMAKESLFAEREQPAKASVVLVLRNRNRPLAPATVTGITRLVAASVEGLRPESVVIIDNFGRPLARPQQDGESALDGLQVERQQRVERDMTQRVVSLLEPVVGEDRVRANVSVRLNAESQEETEERWDPTTVMRSRQTSSENAGGLPTMFAGGVAGARSNLPTPPVSAPPPAGTPPSAGAPSSPATAAPLSAAATVAARPAPGVAGAAAARSAETTNFEVGKTVRHTVRPRGDIARISVAVLIDNEQIAKPGQPGTTTRRARTPADLQKIQGIVAAAVGLDPSRGDQLTVENIPFDNGAELPVPIAGTWERYGPQLMDAARIAAVVLLGLAALLVVIRPAIRRTLAALPAVVPVPQLPAHLPRTVDDLQGELAAQLEEAESNSVESRKLLSKRVSTLAQKEPENAARLIRSWLSEEEAQ